MVGVTQARTADLSQVTIDTDLVMGAYDITLGAAQTVDGVDIGAPGNVIGNDFPKIASANLRNSHDAEVTHNTSTYTKKKTITFTNGIKGTLTIKFDMKAVDNHVRAEVRKNGVLVGANQDTNSTTYVTKSQDINVGMMEPGETLEMWLSKYTSSGVGCSVENFRIYYDNVADEIGVAASNS